MSIEGTGIKIHLGHIEVGEQVRWIHNPASETGVLCFPTTWLSSDKYVIHEISVHVVEPELEYVLKRWPELLNPQWVPRQKDTIALEWVESFLEERGVDRRVLRSQVSVDWVGSSAQK